ncbi:MULTISPECIES: SMC-Scp complex subunit ScpB [Acidobacterium]|uniref:Segregation and condensation protein B n=1 Tax=Acidobacterium capsulatum (strain ATCC 51196 / DSM 11244 / BCRC 80197 / JCM 7670 / NBRC 15755 / NCIMB 13165 / 161) TaxID=240015 RepID=C1F237_ACIC5|nr:MULTISPECIES: SMC-Scp complex subunit ScpB [Acidobacterium]ACO33084.1 segregation and condensation protein B [Acidobacterium capsulatum ATCC 51196]HCT61316.1 SMC-Scp complex subunit ScpB [Acidobacterium sp.]
MSLKARIEAVIYAAEEPVTLAQLAALFGEDALEQKQQREAEAAEEAEARAAESAAIAEADAEEAEEVMAAPAEGEVESAEDAGAEEEAQSEAETPAEEAEAGTLEASEPENAEDGTAEEPEEEAQGTAEVPTEETVATETPEEIDEKKLARLREREIRDELRRTVEELIAEYAKSDRGMEIREVAGGYRVGTRPEYHDSVRAFVRSLKPPIKLSLQALETLAVIAYKQPVTAPEVGEIRGVDSAGVIGSLIGRKLVTTAGRKQVIGRPILYKTTKEFLLRFGLKDLNELPSMEEFEKMAGELNESLPFDEEQTEARAQAEEKSAAADEAVEAPAELGRPRVEIEVEGDGGAIAVTDESTIYEDVPGVATAVSVVAEAAVVETAEGAEEDEAEETAHA